MSTSLRRNTIELLAPTGGFEQLEYALHFGADAVYLAGDRFGLRVRADNFSYDELRAVVEMVHASGKRVFVTINALMHNEDLEPLGEYVAFLGQIDVDAVILSDLASLAIVKERAPELEIHISTQASITNWQTAKMWHAMGAKRVVLARELSVAEIRDIREHIPDDLEIEVFVHGAMCMSYSGRCLISNYLNNRDANRGHCTQPCRWNYALVERTRPGKYIPIEEDARGTYVMNSKDLMMLDHIQDLVDAGVDSLKIEGRVKGAYYVATVVNAYRQVLDGAPIDEFIGELDKVSHRPYHTGFFYGPADQTLDEGEYMQTHDLVGRVLEWQAPESDGANGRVVFQQRNRFWTGDEIEVLSPGRPVRSFIVNDLRTQWGELTDVANKATDTYSMECPFEVEPLDLLRRRRDETPEATTDA